MGSHILIVEIDENQHRGYSCENRRIMELSQDVGHRATIFIRFNPDSYIRDGKKITSCWRLNKLGVLTICKRGEWEERIQTLLSKIRYYIDNPMDKIVEVIELYY